MVGNAQLVRSHIVLGAESRHKQSWEHYPRLRSEVTRALQEKELLVKGPFVEALPDFTKAQSLEALTQGESPLLHPAFSRLPATEFERLLQSHQHLALEAIIGHQQNVVVATGTGSGKTECFLYPILDSLVKESGPNPRGVRALLVYPLNALANDQLYKRPVPLFVHRFQDEGITVGRYTGLTCQGLTRPQAGQEILNSDPFFRETLGWSRIPANWLLTREEMLASPPHILITNYAMLEHLLLFPRNAPLFQTPTLRFLVLDEAHSYSGAQATEVAFLIRKLRRRLGLRPEDTRCIATSADFAMGESADGEIVRFASDLFGAQFARLIRGRRQEHPLLRQHSQDSFSLSPQAWIALGQAIRPLPFGGAEAVATFNQIVSGLNLPESVRARLCLPERSSLASSLRASLPRARKCDASQGFCPKLVQSDSGNSLRTSLARRPRLRLHFRV